MNLITFNFALYQSYNSGTGHEPLTSPTFIVLACHESERSEWFVVGDKGFEPLAFSV